MGRAGVPNEVGVSVGATLAVRDGRHSIAAVWALALAFVALSLVALHAVAATPMEEESAELVRLVDFNPNQALRDGESSLRQAQAKGDLQAELRAWRILALVHDELLDMAALRNDIAQGQPLARKLGHTDAQCQDRDSEFARWDDEPDLHMSLNDE